MTFPYELVPDGEVGVLHHFYWGGFVALFAAAVVWDNQRRSEPLVTTAGTGTALAFFGMWWPFYPVSGAAIAAVGVAVGLGGVVSREWSDYPTRWRIVAGLGLAVMADDWLSHALGIWTPLDAGFRAMRGMGLIA